MTEPVTIDRDALRAKYREERDKRLRDDANEPHIEPTRRFAHLLDDPYTARVEREPRFAEVPVAVIRGGFAGTPTEDTSDQARAPAGRTPQRQRPARGARPRG